MVGLAVGRATAPDGDDAPAARAPAPATDDGGPLRRPPSLEIGLVTTDAGVLTPPGEPAIAGFDAARALVARIAPRRVRIDVRWDLLQPDAAQPLDPDRVIGDGCGREAAPPCAGPVSLTATLRAVAAAQKAAPGRFRPLINFWGMPAWAGAPPTEGCEAASVREGARPLAAGQEPAYRAAVAAVWKAVHDAGIPAADWTPWNEPNAPYFLGPQRASCDPTAAPTAPAQYARLVTAMDDELGVLRRRQPTSAGQVAPQLVVGELAAWAAPGPRAVPSDEFLRALPDEVLCRADVLSLHGYFEAKPRSGRGEPVAAGLREFDRRPCLDRRPAWITETGVGAPRAGGRRDDAKTTLTAECRLMDRQLDHWWHDPRVTAAFQYSVREDPAFPVGLLDEPLSRSYPVADLWAAWGGDRAPAAAPPTLPTDCRTAGRADGASAPPG